MSVSDDNYQPCNAQFCCREDRNEARCNEESAAPEGVSRDIAEELSSVERAWPSDDDYLRNGPGGERFFYPISHTNPNNYLCWETIREFDLLRSHAVADQVMGDLAKALEAEVAAAGESASPASRDALARYRKIIARADR